MYKVGSLPPEGYLAWHEWAAVQHKGGLKQSQCNECKLWFFPQEMKNHKHEKQNKKGTNEWTTNAQTANSR